MTLAEKIQETTGLLHELKDALRTSLEDEVRDCVRVSGQNGTLTMYLEQMFREAKRDVMGGETLKDRIFGSCAAIVATEMILELKAEEAGE